MSYRVLPRVGLPTRPEEPPELLLELLELEELLDELEELLVLYQLRMYAAVLSAQSPTQVPTLPAGMVAAIRLASCVWLLSREKL